MMNEKEARESDTQQRLTASAVRILKAVESLPNR